MPASSPQKQAPNDPNAKTLGFNDLQKMMQAIQQLSASGNREQAAQMLAALQNMLENMRMAKSGSGGKGSQQNTELNQAIQEYGDLMGQQRALMDKTLRQQQGKGDPKDGGAARPGPAAGRTAPEAEQIDAEARARWATDWARPARRWIRRRNR